MEARGGSFQIADSAPIGRLFKIDMDSCVCRLASDREDHMGALNVAITSMARKLLTSQQKQRLKRGNLVPLYDTRDWYRVELYRTCSAFIRKLGAERLDALEISSGHHFQQHNFRSYREANYPAFDICEAKLEERFDLIIADQVFEHLKWPYRAGRNVHAMLKPGGWFICATPFMVRLHDGPMDCSRWSEDGLLHLLAECGFDLDSILTGSWGNRSWIKAHMDGTWPRRGFFGSLKNEPGWPVAVWAFAQR